MVAKSVEAAGKDGLCGKKGFSMGPNGSNKVNGFWSKLGLTRVRLDYKVVQLTRPRSNTGLEICRDPWLPLNQGEPL